MPTIERSALVEYSSQQMFDLINDIEAYPEFMAGCLAARIDHRGDDWVEATLTLGKNGIQQQFTTRNQLQAPDSMVMQLVDGPFRRFEGRWQFIPLGAEASGCKVSLDLLFEFGNPILGLAAGKWLQDIASRQVESLCQRAQFVYGENNRP